MYDIFLFPASPRIVYTPRANDPWTNGRLAVDVRYTRQ